MISRQQWCGELKTCRCIENTGGTQYVENPIMYIVAWWWGDNIRPSSVGERYIGVQLACWLASLLASVGLRGSSLWVIHDKIAAKYKQEQE